MLELRKDKCSLCDHELRVYKPEGGYMLVRQSRKVPINLDPDRKSRTEVCIPCLKDHPLLVPEDESDPFRHGV